MLCLSRKPNEAIILEVDGLQVPIRVQVIQISRGRVMLGLAAPRSVKIMREEVADRGEISVGPVSLHDVMAQRRMAMA